jgi:hypothetical protein
MIKTQDGHELSTGDYCVVVTLDENHEFVESFTECIYNGSWVKDNQPIIDSVPPGASGGYIPPTQTMHRFECVSALQDVDENFDLLEREVKRVVVKDTSGLEEVVKVKLRH